MKLPIQVIPLLFAGLVGPQPTRTETPARPVIVTSRDSARHVLQRLAWGPRPGEVERVMAMGSQAWIDRQLSVPGPGDPRRLASERGRISLRTTTPDLLEMLASARARADTGRQIRSASNPQGLRGAQTLRAVLIDYAGLTLARQVESEHQLAEVLVDFWANHFNVFLQKGLDRALFRDHIEQAIRPHIFGRFEELLVATATSPAMLFYLDNTRSVTERPSRPGAMNRGLNENYARELMELHTLGVEGGYTQQDVVAVARALTGWGIDPRLGTFRFAERAHDRGAKQILGTTFGPGGGEAEGRQVLHLLSTQPATMHHLSGKLCARLVADDPPPACVAAAMEAWRSTDGTLRDVVRAIVSTDAFWAEASAPTKFKSPQEFAVSALRALAIDPARAARLVPELERLGQPLFQQSAPTGWPERASEWVSTSALLARMNFATALAQGRIDGLRVDRATLRRFPTESAPLIAMLDRELLGGSMSVTTRRTIEAQLATTEEPTIARELAIGLTLGSPEFQRQ